MATTAKTILEIVEEKKFYNEFPEILQQIILKHHFKKVCFENGKVPRNEKLHRIISLANPEFEMRENKTTFGLTKNSQEVVMLLLKTYL